MRRDRFDPLPVHWSEARGGADELSPAQTQSAIGDFGKWLQHWPRGLPCRLSFSQWVAIVQRGGGAPPETGDPLLDDMLLDVETKLRLWAMMFLVASLSLYRLLLDAPTGRLSPDDRLRRARCVARQQDDGALLVILAAGSSSLIAGASTGGIDAVRSAFHDERQNVDAFLHGVEAAGAPPVTIK